MAHGSVAGITEEVACLASEAEADLRAGKLWQRSGSQEVPADGERCLDTEG